MKVFQAIILLTLLSIHINSIAQELEVKWSEKTELKTNELFSTSFIEANDKYVYSIFANNSYIEGFKKSKLIAHDKLTMKRIAEFPLQGFEGTNLDLNQNKDLIYYKTFVQKDGIYVFWSKIDLETIGFKKTEIFVEKFDENLQLIEGIKSIGIQEILFSSNEKDAIKNAVVDRSISNFKERYTAHNLILRDENNNIIIALHSKESKSTNDLNLSILKPNLTVESLAEISVNSTVFPYELKFFKNGNLLVTNFISKNIETKNTNYFIEYTYLNFITGETSTFECKYPFTMNAFQVNPPKIKIEEFNNILMFFGEYVQQDEKNNPIGGKRIFQFEFNPKNLNVSELNLNYFTPEILSPLLQKDNGKNIDDNKYSLFIDTISLTNDNCFLILININHWNSLLVKYNKENTAIWSVKIQNNEINRFFITNNDILILTNSGKSTYKIRDEKPLFDKFKYLKINNSTGVFNEFEINLKTENNDYDVFIKNIKEINSTFYIEYFNSIKKEQCVGLISIKE